MNKLLKVGLACAVFAVAAITVNAKGDDYADFKKKIESTVTKTKKEAAEALPSSTAEAFPSYARALEDPYWTVRMPVIEKIIQFDSPELRAQFAAFMMDDKFKAALKDKDKVKAEKVRNLMLWSYARSSLVKVEEWKPIQDVAMNDKMPMFVRSTAARAMTRWPAGAPPKKPDPNATEEGRKEIEAQNKQINEISQPILKSNFKVLLDLLRLMKTDAKLAAKVGEKSKDTEARLLKWLTIYALEKITSEERGDSPDAWDIFWQGIEKNNGDLVYRFDNERKEMDVASGEKVNSRTTERKVKKKDNSTHLLVMPQLFYPDDYFEPFISEFAQYFKLSTFVSPSGEKLGRPATVDPRAKNQPKNGAYYYPTEKIGQLFVKLREKEGGMVGMLCHGDASPLAMEYAKADPEGCAFIICIGAFSGFQSQTQAWGKAENSKDSATKWCFRARKWPAPDPLLDEFQQLDADTGDISHQFGDLYNPDQPVINQQQVRFIRSGGMDTGGKSVLLDDKYEFKSNGLSVPALFIWGENDPVYSDAAQKNLQKGFPNGSFVKMKGVSRLPWLEDPVGFMDEFHKFMDEKKVWQRIDKAKEAADKAAAKEKGKSAGDKGDKKDS